MALLHVHQPDLMSPEVHGQFRIFFTEPGQHAFNKQTAANCATTGRRNMCMVLLWVVERMPC